MYVRMFLSAVDPADVPEFRRTFSEQIAPVLARQPGCESIELLANVEKNAGGLVEGVALSRWRSREELEAALALPEVQEAVAHAYQYLRQEPVTKVFEVLE